MNSDIRAGFNPVASSKAFAKATALLGMLLVSAAAQSATIPIDLDFDLTSIGTESNTGNVDSIGNTWSYTVNGYTLQATAWADTGTDNSFAEATGVHTGQTTGNATLGLGVCNAAEMPLSTCDTLPAKKDTAAFYMDNSSEIDWILILFPEQMTINSFSVKPGEKAQRSVSYFTGLINSADAIKGLTPADLAGFIGGSGFDNQVNSDLKVGETEATEVVTHTGYRNALLIGASQQKKNSSISLTNVSVTTVPVPPAIWLFGSAILALAAKCKKRHLSTA